MSAPATILFKIEGENVRPETVPLREVVTAALHLERAVRRNYTPDESEAETEADLHLIGIGDGSVTMHLTAAKPVVDSAVEIKEAIQSRDLYRLEQRSRRAIEELVHYGKQRNWSYSLASPDLLLEPTVFSWETLPQLTSVRSITTLYGRVVRVGGRDPRATLRTPGGEVTVNLSDQQMATELGKRLYEWVGLEGEAIYDARDWSIHRFSARNIGPYRRVPAKQALSELAETAGSAWDDIDPEEYVRQLRSDDAA